MQNAERSAPDAKGTKMRRLQRNGLPESRGLALSLKRLAFSAERRTLSAERKRHENERLQRNGLSECRGLR